MTSTPELNEMLLDECVYEKPNYQKIEELLKSGARPLGEVVYCNTLVYCNIVESCESKELPKTTELFLKYGMDISKPDIAYKECNETNPLRMFAFYSDEYALLTLRLLLDYGLDADSAEECWGHILFDYYNCWGYLEDAFCYEMLYDAIRKIMLIASYPHICKMIKHYKKSFGWNATPTILKLSAIGTISVLKLILAIGAAKHRRYINPSLQSLKRQPERKCGNSVLA